MRNESVPGGAPLEQSTVLPFALLAPPGGCRSPNACLAASLPSSLVPTGHPAARTLAPGPQGSRRLRPSEITGDAATPGSMHCRACTCPSQLTKLARACACVRGSFSRAVPYRSVVLARRAGTDIAHKPALEPGDV